MLHRAVVRRLTLSLQNLSVSGAAFAKGLTEGVLGLEASGLTRLVFGLGGGGYVDRANLFESVHVLFEFYTVY